MTLLVRALRLLQLFRRYPTCRLPRPRRRWKHSSRQVSSKSSGPQSAWWSAKSCSSVHAFCDWLQSERGVSCSGLRIPYDPEVCMLRVPPLRCGAQGSYRSESVGGSRKN